jgi:hypothetical protein
MQPVVMVENGKFHMWYGGNHGNRNSAELQNIDICYATSTDGYNWTKYSGNPVIKNGAPDSAWNGIALRPSEIVQVGTNYTLFYKAVGTTGGQGAKPKLGSHSSTDLVNWTANPSNPLYVPSASSWEKEKTNYMSVQRIGSMYRMWTWVNLAAQKIGWLHSWDLETWKDSGGPVISPESGTIYSSDIAFPRLVEQTGDDLLYFRGTSGGTNRFGVFEIVPEALEGTFTSRVLDAGGRVDLTGIDWNWTNEGGGWIDLSLRWTNDTGAWGTWRAFDNSTEPLGVNARYYQYRAVLNVSQGGTGSSLQRLRLDFNIPVVRVEVSVDGAAYQTVQGTPQDWWANVSLRDGDYNVIVRATDARGAYVSTTVPVRVDLYPPTGSILIEEGRWATNSTAVLIETYAQDTHGPFEMQLSRDPNFQGATWGPLRTSDRWQLLGDPEGNVTIYARFRDDAGRVSEVYNDSIVIDTTPPTGTLRINDGDKYTNSTDVRLSLTWADLTGVVSMMVSNDPRFTGSLWQDPMKSLYWRLDDQDGERAVYVRLRDAVGWTTTLMDTIIYDSTPPAASMSINGDDDYTSSATVDLSIALYDANPVRIKLANHGDPWPAVFTTVRTPTTVPWVLSPGPDGERTVRMLVEDAAGNTYVTSDDIVLDTTPPEGTLVLNGGATFTRELLVTGELAATDATSGLDRMRVGVTDDLDGVAWQTVKETFTWLLSPGDGSTTVYVELLDRAGNTATVDASIILDTTPPSGTLAIEGGAGYVADPLVTLTVDVTDAYGIADMRLTNGFGFTDEEWVPYSTSLPWDLGASGGPKTVFIEVRDLAGNTFTTSASTMLDLVDPVANLVIEGGAEATVDLAVGFVWSASDNLGLASIAVSEDPSFENAQWLDLDGVTVFEEPGELTLSPGDGLKTLHVRVVDVAGRTRDASDSIWYVSRRPEGAVVLGDGSGWTNASRVDAAVTWTGGSDATHFRVSMSDEIEASEWVPIDGTTTVVVGSAGGPRTVYAQLLGPHNVTSLVFNGSITLDLVAPSVAIDRPAGGSVEDESVTLSISASDDLDPSPAVRWRVNGGEWTEYSGETKLDLSEGRNLIEVEAVDAAGNVASAEGTVTLERSMLVGGTSWFILLALLVAVGVVALWYWRRRGEDPMG